jgi:hypothetical protein
MDINSLNKLTGSNHLDITDIKDLVDDIINKNTQELNKIYL